MSVPVDDDPGRSMRAATPARIGLARAGASIATREHLAFQLAHARARDAVHAPFDPDVARSTAFASAASKRAACTAPRPTARPISRAPISAAGSTTRSRGPKAACRAATTSPSSSPMACRRAPSPPTPLPLLDEALPPLRRDGWRIGPVAVVEQGRVAIGDEIGDLLGAALVCVLIGERPGLTSPDSLGVYLTWQPAIGRTDAERNCLSNIRPAGMAYDEAAQRLVYLCGQARLRQCTGVMLKDETPSHSARLEDNGPGEVDAPLDSD